VDGLDYLLAIMIPRAEENSSFQKIEAAHLLLAVVVGLLCTDGVCGVR
jgi:hypothetical protein